MSLVLVVCIISIWPGLKGINIYIIVLHPQLLYYSNKDQFTRL